MDSYHPPLLFRPSHTATILPNLFRPIDLPPYQREELNLEDGDFIHLDHWHTGNKKLALLIHGLEGSSASGYMSGMAHAMHRTGHDVTAMNLRGCSGTANILASAYHSGKTDDLHRVIKHLDPYDAVVLIGFSLGGNIVLKYAGEGRDVQSVKAAVAISAPVHLASSATALSKPTNAIYLHRFLKQLKRKAIAKARAFPQAAVSEDLIVRAQNFIQFDNAYTAPVHGFLDAADYYEKNSSIHFLGGIAVPTLIINALNDSFLAKPCYPFEEARQNKHIILMTPEHGGHVGFATNHFMRGQFWHEQQVIDFIQTFGP